MFGWSNFSITVVELCPVDTLHSREDWYLSVFCPLLNFLMVNPSGRPVLGGPLSLMTRSRISLALQGRVDSVETRRKKSLSRLGINNPFFGKGPGIKALDKAAELSGTMVYVYDASTFTLVGQVPFRSIRAAALVMPISASTLPNKLNTGIPFKGYYYYSTPRQFPR